MAEVIIDVEFTCNPLIAQEDEVHYGTVQFKRSCVFCV